MTANCLRTTILKSLTMTNCQCSKIHTVKRIDLITPSLSQSAVAVRASNLKKINPTILLRKSQSRAVSTLILITTWSMNFLSRVASPQPVFLWPTADKFSPLGADAASRAVAKAPACTCLARRSTCPTTLKTSTSKKCRSSFVANRDLSPAAIPSKAKWKNTYPFTTSWAIIRRLIRLRPWNLYPRPFHRPNRRSKRQRTL